MIYVKVHGIKARDDYDNLDSLDPWLEGQIIDADYGYLPATFARIINPFLARMLRNMTPAGAIGVGHSNGCALLIKAAELGAPFKRLILINPALDSDAELPPQIEKCLVLANRHDHIVRAASVLPWHSWGAMGKTGYTGKDKRYTNIFTDETLSVKGHGAVFEKPQQVAQYINEFAR